MCAVSLALGGLPSNPKLVGVPLAATNGDTRTCTSHGNYTEHRSHLRSTQFSRRAGIQLSVFGPLFSED